MNHFRWSQFSEQGEAFHLVRKRMKGRRATMLHSQDFSEVFWIEEGGGTHVVNGNALPVEKGDLVFVRANDIHAFRSPPAEDGFVIVNIAFASATPAYLQKRYFPGEKRWFLCPGSQPETFRLDDERLSWLRKWVDRLDSGDRSRLNIEIFLLELLRELRTNSPARSNDDGPPWLHEVLAKAADPRIFSQGTVALACAAGCTPQHLNATIRKHRSLTATEVLNAARMEFAARELRTSTKKIIEISLDCGFQNLAHFYSLFKAHAKMTPKDYRRAHQTPIR